MARKAPIPQTLNNLVPLEYSKYKFFEGVDAPGMAFDSTAQAFNVVNAGWLADASLLAYGKESVIHRETEGLIKHSPKMTVKVFSVGDTQAWVLNDPKFAIVAFRGTRIDEFPSPFAFDSAPVYLINLRDSITDIHWGLGRNGIHQGFWRALYGQVNGMRVWDQLVPYLERLGDVKIWFTGHSLGAALATIAAVEYQDEGHEVAGLYTFGSPRVGDAAFAGRVPKGCYRIVNNNDMIARLPPVLFTDYADAGELRYIDRNGNVKAGASLDDELLDGLVGQWEAVLDSARQSLFNLNLLHNLRNLKFKIPDDRLTDHAPINYACRMWNAAATAQGQ